MNKKKMKYYHVEIIANYKKKKSLIYLISWVLSHSKTTKIKKKRKF